MGEISRNNRLKNVLRAGMVWDLAGGTIFLVVHGILQKQLTPPINPFYSIVIGIFLMLSAYIQLVCSEDIKRYSANIGLVIYLRVAFAIAVLFYSVWKDLLPMQFFMIAIVDSVLVCLLLLFAVKDWDFSARDIFIN